MRGPGTCRMAPMMTSARRAAPPTRSAGRIRLNATQPTKKGRPVHSMNAGVAPCGVGQFGLLLRAWWNQYRSVTSLESSTIQGCMRCTEVSSGGILR